MNYFDHKGSIAKVNFYPPLQFLFTYVLSFAVAVPSGVAVPSYVARIREMVGHSCMGTTVILILFKRAFLKHG